MFRNMDTLKQCFHILVIYLTFTQPVSEASVSRVLPDLDFSASAVCEGTTLEMECPRGYFIELTEGTYGRTDTTTCVDLSEGGGPIDRADLPCEGVSIWDIRAITSCAGQRTCSVEVTREALGITPCPSKTFSKYLTMSYKCIKNRLRSFVCEGSRFNLRCPGGDVIQVVDVTYGRTDPDRCSLNSQILSTNCTAENATERVSELCNHKPFCEVDATSLLFGDPCEGTTKILDIEIQCASCTNDHGSDLRCDGWNEDGECDSNSDWMLANCRKSCWSCDTAATCTDVANTRSCLNWAARGECLLNKKWMMNNCQYSCNKCHETFMEPDDGSVDRWIPPNPDLAPENTVRELTCYDNELLMECPINSFVQVYDAFYGRESEDICPPPADITETYSPCPTTAKPYNRTSWVCDGRRDCMITALNTVFEEPCADSLYYEKVNYYLKVNYSCQACENKDSNEICEREAEAKGCTSWEMHQNCFKTCSGCEYSENCQNQWTSDVDCDFWASNGECESNENWMAIQCTKSCRLCIPGDAGAGSPGTRPPPVTRMPPIPDRTSPPSTTQATTPVVIEVCENALGDETCADRVDDGACEQDPGNMIKQCRRACGFCIPVTLPPLEADCGDILDSSYCRRIADPRGDNECINEPEYMAINCRLTCNFCRPLPATTPTTTQSTTTTRSTTPTTTTQRTTTTTQESVCPEQCVAWVRTNQCIENRDLMRQFCPEVCCQPGGVPTTERATSTTTTTTQQTTTAIVDTVEQFCEDGLCLSWVRDGQCEINPDLMAQFCPSVCCQPGAIPTTPPPTQPPTTTSTTQSSTQTTTSTPPTTTTTTTTSTTTQPTTSVTTPGCQSTSEFPDGPCETWVNEGQCQMNPGFMAAYCTAECCGGTPTTTQSTSTSTTTRSTTQSTTEFTTTRSAQACDNRPEYADRCERWALEQDQCTLAEDFMREYCKLSCGWCPGRERTTTIRFTTSTATTPTTTVAFDASCVDNHTPSSQCQEWAASNLCGDRYMIENCKRSCGLCPTPTTPTTTIDPSLINCPEPCVNGRCAGPNLCDCEPGWSGPLCEEITCPGEDDICSGNGECIGPNRCFCEQYWTGDACQTPTCPQQNECNGNGLCVAPNECWCFPHYSGRDCVDCDLVANKTQSSCMYCPPCTNGKCKMEEPGPKVLTYKGCYKDDLVSRDLEITAWKQNEDNTVRDCVVRCYGYGYKYAGLQMGEECHCGDLFGLYQEADNCDIPCPGGVNGEICGGLYANSIYQVYTGECECDGPQWSGALCDKCADGLEGEACDRTGTTRPTLPPPPTVQPRTTPPRPRTTSDTRINPGTNFLPLQMRLSQSWSDSYSDLTHPRTRIFIQKLQPALVELYKRIFPQTEDVEILSLSQGSVIIKYRLIFLGPAPFYNTTLKLACEGQAGYQEQPPEGWQGHLNLLDGRQKLAYEIPSESRDPCYSGPPIGVIPSGGDGTREVMVSECNDNGNLTRDANGTTYCRCEEGYSGSKCQVEESSGLSKWVSLGIIIAVGTVPLLILLIVCCCVCRAKDTEAYKMRQKYRQDTIEHHKNGKAKISPDGTASRTFQFYEMGKKTGATTTIKKSHSKKGQPMSPASNDGFEDDLEQGEYFDD